MGRVLIKNAVVVDGTSPERRGPLDVAIEDGRIVEVAANLRPQGEAIVVDIRGRTLMPGLSDAHVHIVANSLNLAALDELPASLVSLNAGNCLKETLLRGFTTVRDAGGADWGYASAV